MKKVFYTFALLAVSLMSCESNSDDETNPPVTSNNENILPTKVDIVYSDGETETIQYTYSGMTLIKEESSDGYYTDYIYEDNKLTEINFYNTPTLEILESYTYDAQGRVATFSTNIVGTEIYENNLTYNEDNSLITSSSITFPEDEHSTITISNGNMTNENTGGGYITTYTHDTKNAPFKNIDNRAILLSISTEANENWRFNTNNILTDITTHDTDPNSVINSHIYTTFNYPRTTTKNNDGDIETYTYTYNND